jgi:toxin secretion/phage lysis holin
MHDLIGGLTQYLWQKALIALGMAAGCFILTDDHVKIITLIICIWIIDTALGVMVAIDNRTFSSYRLLKAINKLIRYAVAVATAYIVSLLGVATDFFFYYVGSFIIISEAISNFEKLALLGFALPQKVLSKLNIDFEKMSFGNKEARDRILKKELPK